MSFDYQEYMSKKIEATNKFLADHNATIEIEFIEGCYDGYYNLYTVTITRTGRHDKSRTFNVRAEKDVNAYRVLCRIEKYGYGSYANFCNTVGHYRNSESRELYEKAKKDYKNIRYLFADCIEELRKIC